MTNDKSKKSIIATLYEDYCRKYSSKTLAREFLNSLADLESHDFGLQTIYADLVDEFNKQGKECKSHSHQNWRFEKQPNLASRNESAEKVLEKNVVKHPKHTLWVNQVPVASGVFTGRADGHRAIDLVCRVCEGNYEFVELKIRSNNPVYAAYEILLYGVVYVFYRKNAILWNKGDAEKEILKAEAVSLIVAAPHDYFKGYPHLEKLQNLLSMQLSNWASKTIEGFSMNFRFDSFDYDDSEKCIEKNVNSFLDKKSYR